MGGCRLWPVLPRRAIERSGVWEPTCAPVISLMTSPRLTAFGGNAVGFHFEFFNGRRGLGEIRDVWNRISQGLDNERFFHRYELYESYLETLADDDSQICFIVAQRDRQPVGVFPLEWTIKTFSGLRLRCLGLINHAHLSLSDALFERSETNRNIVQQLVDFLRYHDDIGWDLLYFPGLIEDGCVRYSLTAAPPRWMLSRTRARSNYLSCAPHEQLTPNLSKNFRGNLRKARNKLAGMSSVEFVTARQNPELHQSLDELIRVEASGWKGLAQEGTAIQLDERLAAFYKSLATNAARADGVEINLLRANGKCLAGQFCLIVKDTSYILKIGYDESFAHLAPGNMLLEYTLQRYQHDGVIRQLSLVTDAPWHANWKPLSFSVCDAYIFKASPLGLAAYVGLRAEFYMRGKLRSVRERLLDKDNTQRTVRLIPNRFAFSTMSSQAHSAERQQPFPFGHPQRPAS